MFTLNFVRLKVVTTYVMFKTGMTAKVLIKTNLLRNLKKMPCFHKYKQVSKEVVVLFLMYLLTFIKKRPIKYIWVELLDEQPTSNNMDVPILTYFILIPLNGHQVALSVQQHKSAELYGRLWTAVCSEQ